MTLSLLMSLGGCASTGRAVEADPFATSGDEPQSIRLQVRNMNFADARIYAIRGSGQRMSLGTVGGKADARFTVPWDFNQALRIEINLLAGRSCTTEVLQVQAGDVLELQIASVFTQSMFCR